MTQSTNAKAVKINFAACSEVLIITRVLVTPRAKHELYLIQPKFGTSCLSAERPALGRGTWDGHSSVTKRPGRESSSRRHPTSLTGATVQEVLHRLQQQVQEYLDLLGLGPGEEAQHDGHARA